MKQFTCVEDFGLSIDDTMIESLQVINTLTAIFEEKDIYTAGHSTRVALYCIQLADAIGVSNEDLKTIYYAGLIHDIGKIKTPESVLFKARYYSDDDQKIIQLHPEEGERMLRFIPQFKACGTVIRHHHERYDGLGYPDRIAGKNIPFLSRIMAICDAFDAMTSHRIYKERKSIAEAIEELQNCSGKQFDTEIIPQAIALFKTFKELHEIFELPKNAYEEQRFAYFFKDNLTDAYSEAYLNYFLNYNKSYGRFTQAYFIQLHYMNALNKRDGWEIGNTVLIHVVQKVQYLFPHGCIFRVFGDDFFVFLDTASTHSQEKIIEELSTINGSLVFSVMALSILSDDVQTIKDLEKLFIRPIDKTYSKLLTDLLNFDLRIHE